MDLGSFLIAFHIALGLGLVIGLERQLGQHPAGLRTNALVCAGAALYVLLGRSLVQGADAGKVAAQIVSGVGFLGGGVILREGLTVRGLTTAATLWCSAAIGAMCGSDLPKEAAFATAAIVAVNRLLNPVARWVDRCADKRIFIETTYRLKVTCDMSEERRIRQMIADWVRLQPDMTLHGIGIHTADHGDRGTVVAEMETHVRNEHALQEIIATLNADPNTTGASWERHA